MLLHHSFAWLRCPVHAFLVVIAVLWIPVGFAAPGPDVAARPVILASIKPLALIARDLTGDLAEVRQLLPDGASPHEYALRVSDRRLLDSAAIVLWVGPVLEPYLNGAVVGMAPGRALSAAALPDIAWPERGGASGSEGDDHPHDEHLWLDPRNARVIARALAQTLVVRGMDASTQAALGERLRRFEAELDAVEASIDARLAPLRGNPFASDHDGFGHFAHRFDLHSAGYLRDASDRVAGARSVAALMHRSDVRCLVAEPASRLERMQRVAEELGARLVVVDPLGMAGVPPAATGGAYAQLLQKVADGFVTCLGGAAAGH